MTKGPPMSPERLRQRLAGLSDEAMSEEARAALANWWPPYNLHRLLARNPETLTSWIGFGTHILRNNTLDPAVRELAVLRVAWNAQCAYEWGQHARLCDRIGLPAEMVARVPKGADAPGWTELEAAIVRGVDELMGGWSLGDATYDVLAGSLSDRQLLDYVFLVGEFILVALLLNGFRVEPDDGLPALPVRS